MEAGAPAPGVDAPPTDPPGMAGAFLKGNRALRLLSAKRNGRPDGHRPMLGRRQINENIPGQRWAL